MNDVRINADSIFIKYLEVGHTYMSADSVHGNISQKMKSVDKIFDFEDCKTLIENSRTRIKTIAISHSDMFTFSPCARLSRLPRISDARQVMVKRGSANLYLKNMHDDPSFKEVKFLKKATEKQILECLHDGISPFVSIPKELEERGITAEKNKDLLKLAKCMPLHRQQFYTDMKINHDIQDLTTCRSIDF